MTHPAVVNFMRPWWKAIIIAGMMFMLLAAAQEWRTWIPASFWFEVHSVHIHDTVEGTSPMMELDRTIKRPFAARWIVTVMREGRGGFYTFCTAQGENDYHPDSQLPFGSDLNLDWWTWPRVCDLPPGRYVVNSAWYLRPDGWPEKVVRIRSNEFNVSR